MKHKNTMRVYRPARHLSSPLLGSLSIFDLENDLLEQGLSSDHSDNLMLEIYPNPTSSSIRIKNLFSTFEQSAFILYDMTGRVVMKHQIPNGIFTFELDLGMLANGVYQLQIRTANTLQTRKIILEH
ncbi:MAG: T9SS type A sorting domain-containing protein [Bacteroidota bacterium]|nr:MAG: T9SS type A sorting domain-containing protein [Bacteroidota bacterium]